MDSDRQLIYVCIMVAGLLLAGCDESPQRGAPRKPPVDTSAGHSGDSRAAPEPEPESKLLQAPAAAEKKRKPLDLSLPLQPEAPPDPGNGGAGSRGRILPDLFQQQNPDDGRAVHFKGEVLIDEEKESGLDSAEGGRIIIELKTR